MAKTLDEAIGCWTTDPDGLQRLGRMVWESTRICGRRTKQNDIAALYAELQLLQRRIGSLKDLADDAARRLAEIVASGDFAAGCLGS